MGSTANYYWRRKIIRYNTNLPNEDKREENAENEAFEKIMDEDFPNLIKILNSQSNSMNPKQEKLEEKTCQDGTIIKLLK